MEEMPQPSIYKSDDDYMLIHISYVKIIGNQSTSPNGPSCDIQQYIFAFNNTSGFLLIYTLRNIGYIV